MKLSRLSLRLLVPLGLAFAFLVITATSLMTSIEQRSELFIEDSQQQLLGYTTEIARMIEQGGLEDPALLRGRVSSIMSDPRVDTLVATTPDERVLLAPDRTREGMTGEAVVSHFDEIEFRTQQAERLPHLKRQQGGQIIEGLQSFDMLDGLTGPDGRGVVYIRMDLTRPLARIRNDTLIAWLPEAGFMLLIILVMAWLLDSQVTRPMGRLSRAAQRLERGDFSARLPEGGCQEIAQASRGFNAMADAIRHTQERLLESEERLSVTLNSIGEGLIATDLDGKITLMNPVAEEMTGWSREKAAGRPIEDVFVICRLDDNQPMRIPIRRVLSEGTVIGLANHTVLTDRQGKWYHISDNAAPIRKEDGALVGVVLVFHDMTEEYELREALAESEQHFRTLSDNGQALIWTADTNGDRNYANHPWLAFTGLELDETLGQRWKQAVHPDDRQDLDAAIKHAYRRRAAFTREYRLRHHTGEYRWLLVKGTPRFDSHGEFIGFLGQCLDITADKQTAAQLEHLAYHDGLTNLPNRTLLIDRIDQAIRGRKRYHGVGALFFVDLDEFKQVNDLYGHTRGDQVLMEVARRLMAHVSETDTLARLGGDEFLVLIPLLADHLDEARHMAIEIADRLRDAIDKPFCFDDFYHLATASVGLTLFAGKVDDAEDLIREADIAMYEAKQAGRNSLVHFESGMAESATRRYQMEQELKQALQNQEFELHLQSQFDADQQLIGAEVLLRWRHPVRGLVSPGEFIPLAEDSGQIVHIGDWVMREACHLLHGLQASMPSGARPPTISVNVSPRQSRASDFVERVQAALHETQVDPSHLMIEVTENMLVGQASDAVARMRALAALGLNFSIDDFGTGYSSFAYLKRLPLNEIKLDKSFVDGLPADDGNSVMVAAILAMADQLGIEVVAEGVETQAQFDFLKSHNCSRFQGFLLARPIPARDWVAQFLDQA